MEGDTQGLTDSTKTTCRRPILTFRRRTTLGATPQRLQQWTLVPSPPMAGWWLNRGTWEWWNGRTLPHLLLAGEQMAIKIMTIQTLCKEGGPLPRDSTRRGRKRHHERESGRQSSLTSSATTSGRRGFQSVTLLHCCSMWRKTSVETWMRVHRREKQRHVA